MILPALNSINVPNIQPLSNRHFQGRPKMAKTSYFEKNFSLFWALMPAEVDLFSSAYPGDAEKTNSKKNKNPTHNL
jgi:hypothetical protein